ncbi:MAG: glutaredoxin family protein [Pseudomonadota bacterium]
MAAEHECIRFTLYSRSYCHLCDEMIAGLRTLQARFPFQLDVLDVDSDALLEARYGEHVPVLTHGARELSRYRLDTPGVTDYLVKIG